MKLPLRLLLLSLLTACNAHHQLNCDDDDIAYQSAASNGDIKKMGQLKATRTIDQDAHCKDHDTALIDAAYYGRYSAVKMLLDDGAATDIQQKNGWTALIYAANQGHTAIVKLLLKHNADPNIQNTNHGSTALTWAAEKGNIAMVEALLQAGARADIQKKNGSTALSIAKSNGHTAVAEMLQRGRSAIPSTIPRWVGDDQSTWVSPSEAMGQGRSVLSSRVDWSSQAPQPDAKP